MFVVFLAGIFVVFASFRFNFYTICCLALATMVVGVTGCCLGLFVFHLVCFLLWPLTLFDFSLLLLCLSILLLFVVLIFL